jgi:hypothetical protein
MFHMVIGCFFGKRHSSRRKTSALLILRAHHLAAGTWIPEMPEVVVPIMSLDKRPH